MNPLCWPGPCRELSVQAPDGQADRDRPPEPRRISDAVMQTFPAAPLRPIRADLFKNVAYSTPADGKLVDALCGFLSDFAREAGPAGMSGFVIGLSGGLDSTVCAELCRRVVDRAVPVIGVT